MVDGTCKTAPIKTEVAQVAQENIANEPPKPSKIASSQNFINDAFEARPSVLSSDNKGQNYRGFINVCIILLVLAKFEDMIANILKYGVLMKPSLFASVFSGFDCAVWPNVTITLSLSLFFAFAYL
eukprot:CAMPEP_0181334542 /NCGR_PEP_ID=MMETSP1101-20121128/26323_1 /TAXON_ID=46948 /ORGANISM="Rhodomonas abbreviata, Strain Caron Lab Isolate" /LENGTH=125 /DNA_ID=CAMNT_0023444541 /DNA_START=89 /DNA_END=462 /DNA_ORIENTATION=-